MIGADRISTDLHNLVVDTNATLAKPLTLDYEYNDPADPNSFYTRSDHYSYASKGIPIAFFFTGTHPDYHGATDHVDKILFPKLVRDRPAGLPGRLQRRQQRNARSSATTRARGAGAGSRAH